jgi:CheY-like chemotaxis protein
MPDGDAQHLLHRLRSTPATENIPVIVVSGKAVNDLTEQTLRRKICNHPGALRVFAKSFDTKELFDALQKFCGFEKHH